MSSTNTRAGLAIVVLCLYVSLSSSQVVDTTALRIVQPLMENWRFIQDDDLSSEEALASDAASWQTVTLPHTWNAEDAASLEAESYKRGLGWYRLEFPTPTQGARHWLEFGAASLVADVWLNGMRLGRHKGAFTAFRFDVTDTLAESGNNVLLVRTDNSAPDDEGDRTAIAPRGGDFNVSGGLHRHVALISTHAPVHIDLGDLGGPGVYASTAAVEGGTATVTVRTKLRSDAPASAEYRVHLTLLSMEGEPAATAEQPVTLEAGANSEVTQSVSVPNVHLWQGTADPYLYQLVAELRRADGAPIDRVTQRIGIRQMRFDPEQGFFLNGQHVRLTGAAMHQDFLGRGWAITNEDIDTSLALVQEIGANAIRLGHNPFPQYVLERVSELGLVAWAEAALGTRMTFDRCTTELPSKEFVDNAQQQLRELIRQQFNHAAVATWAIGNESTQHQLNCQSPHDNVTPVLQIMHETAKEEDPSRPTVYAEFPHPVGQERTGAFATEGITDLFSTNRYYLWYTEPLSEFSPLLDNLHASTPDQPLAVSEYGGGGALTHHTDNPQGGRPEVRSAPRGETSYQPEEYQAYLHEETYRIISSKPYLWGSFVWTMFDFGSAHRNEGDVLGVNTKGLVTFDRQTRKDAFFFYKANWSDEPVIHIVGRRYTDRAYPVADVKVYSNASSVTLTLNGAAVGTLSAEKCDQRVCLFENVVLTPGANILTATGTHGAATVQDSVNWQLNGTNFHINSGQLWTGYVASNGTRFGSDDFFTGGATDNTGNSEVPRNNPGNEAGGPPSIRGTDDPQLYKYYRHGDFSYEIPLADGTYEVTLGFVEPDEGADAGDRVFSVTANGQALLERFDIVSEAGAPRTALTRTFTVEVSGGQLVLDFTSIEGEALVASVTAARQ